MVPYSIPMNDAMITLFHGWQSIWKPPTQAVANAEMVFTYRA